MKRLYPTFGLIFVFLFCSGVITCGCLMDSHYADLRANKMNEKITNNEGQFKILSIVPVFNVKGQLISHSVIAEGILTKERIQVPIEPNLPVPGEIWLLEIKIVNNDPVFYFVEK